MWQITVIEREEGISAVCTDAPFWCKRMEYTHVTHTFGPVYDDASRILILGSFPSVKSREQQFYYGHPQNRFWKVLAAVFEDTLPETIPQKKAFLLEHHIALWDVIASCDIAGSSDSSIRNVTANDMEVILKTADHGASVPTGIRRTACFLNIV